MAKSINPKFKAAIGEMTSRHIITQDEVNSREEHKIALREQVRKITAPEELERALESIDQNFPAPTPTTPAKVEAITSTVAQAIAVMPDTDNIFAEANRDFVIGYGCGDKTFSWFQAHSGGDSTRDLAGTLVHDIISHME